MSEQFEKDLIKALNRLAAAEEIKGQYLGKVALSIETVAMQIKWLGSGNASTEMGAIEFLASQIKEAGENVAGAISEAKNSDG